MNEIEKINIGLAQISGNIMNITNALNRLENTQLYNLHHKMFTNVYLLISSEDYRIYLRKPELKEITSNGRIYYNVNVEVDTENKVISWEMFKEYNVYDVAIHGGDGFHTDYYPWQKGYLKIKEDYPDGVLMFGDKGKVVYRVKFNDKCLIKMEELRRTMVTIRSFKNVLIYS